MLRGGTRLGMLPRSATEFTVSSITLGWGRGKVGKLQTWEASITPPLAVRRGNWDGVRRGGTEQSP